MVIAVLIVFGLSGLFFISSFETNKVQEAVVIATARVADVTASYRTSIAPTPTFTQTSTPTITPSLTATLTLTPLPSLTSTPAIKPCLVRMEAQTPAIYQFPSKDDRYSSRLVKPADVYLYYKLEDEPWWRASSQSSAQGNGWVYAGDIVSNDCANSLPMNGGLENIDTLASAVIYQDTFSSYTSNWVPRPLQQKSTSDGFQLVFPDLEFQSVTLSEKTLGEKNTVWLSFRRVPFNKDNFTGIRFDSDRTSGTYLEFRLFSDCRYQYSYYLDDSLKEQSPLNAVDSNQACAQEASSLLVLHLDYDAYQGTINLGGQFAGYNLAGFSIKDSKNYLESSLLTLISDGKSYFDYILITTP